MQTGTHRERDVRRLVVHEPSDGWHFDYEKCPAQTSNPNIACLEEGERREPASLPMWFLVEVCLAIAIGVPLGYVLIEWGVGR